MFDKFHCLIADFLHNLVDTFYVFILYFVTFVIIETTRYH